MFTGGTDLEGSNTTTTENELIHKAAALRLAEEELKTEKAPDPAAAELKKVFESSVTRPAEVSKFLNLVAQGWQDAAEKMLKEDPTLILARGDVNDLAGRNFYSELQKGFFSDSTKGVHPGVAQPRHIV